MRWDLSSGIGLPQDKGNVESSSAMNPQHRRRISIGSVRLNLDFSSLLLLNNDIERPCPCNQEGSDQF